ncbi:MAG: sulfotransferase family protein [Moorea sp. SIO2B7]|nr:sulfotransferase family protein [Moorena sp. SIO2B7]
MKIKPKRKGLSTYLRSHDHQGGIIVCEPLKFIYMKPTKTAGTSILRAGLEKRLSGIIHHKDHPEQFKEWINRITDEELEDYFIFSVVRNPWDRLVSVSAYFNIPFKDFVNNIDKYWKNYNLRIHSLPLHLYTHCNGEQFVDMICRFESLQPDLNLCFDQINIDREKLAFVNRSKHRHYSLYYTDSEIKIVESIYKKDIEYFGYMFEPNFVHKDSFISKLNRHLRKIKNRAILALPTSWGKQ